MSMPPPPPPVAPSGVRYGGFWIRVVAYIIDYVITGGITYGLLVATKPISCQDAGDGTCLPGTTTVSGLFYVLIAIPVVYYIVAWAIGGTIGQRVLGMRLVNATTGQALGVGRSLLRLVGYIISTAVIFIGLIWVAFDPRKQGWHDKIAGSVVIRT